MIQYWRKSKMVATSTNILFFFLQLCMNKDPLLLLYQFILCYNYWTMTKAFITKHAPHSKNRISFAPLTCFPGCSGITKAYSHQGWWFPARQVQEMCPGCAWRAAFPSWGTAGAAAAAARGATASCPQPWPEWLPQPRVRQSTGILKTAIYYKL